MMAVEAGGDWPTWAQNLVAGVLTAIGTLGVAHFNKKAALEKAESDRKAKLEETIDNRIRTILADDEKTIKRLSSKIDALEAYVRTLIGALIKAGVALPPMPRTEEPGREDETAAA